MADATASLAPGLNVQAACRPPALAGLSVFSAVLSPVSPGSNWDWDQSACSVNQARAVCPGSFPAAVILCRPGCAVRGTVIVTGPNRPEEPVWTAVRNVDPK